MSQATVQFQLGAETVTSVLDIELGGETIITGDFGGVVPAGTVARLRGNVRLIDNLHVRGTLVCDPTGVNLDGQNLYDIHTHDGTLNLQGVEKSAWVWWGDPVVGWQTGDRLAVVPTKAGAYVSTEIVWNGSWAATSRPANSPDVSLLDGRVMKPEVANLAQTVTLRNLKRIMVHEASAPNPQTLKWIRVLDSGEAAVLGHYPIHFHQIYDHSRGSLVEGVVVEGGKHRAFVPHGSHGVTMKGCVAYKSQSGPFWWDPPISKTHTANNSNDTVWERCLALGGSNLGRQGFAFALGAGSGNRCVGCVAVGFEGFDDSGKDEVNGFYWTSDANQNVGGNVWEFHDNVAHNNSNGLRAWQNDSNDHIVEDFVVYRNKRAGVIHGAYINNYRFDRMLSQGNGECAFVLHGLGEIYITDAVTDGALHVKRHFAQASGWVEISNSPFTAVEYNEQQDNFSRVRYIDCGLTPTDFTMIQVRPLTLIEIVEAGVVAHRWVAGVWS